MQWIGIWVYPYTVTLVQVGANFRGNVGEWVSSEPK